MSVVSFALAAVFIIGSKDQTLDNLPRPRSTLATAIP